ncbi:MAG: HAD hydrolase-like protein [Pseudomonadales bacterium]|nr:HAD hydrolase-like protein [Pseudomonadales bacterium]
MRPPIQTRKVDAILFDFDGTLAPNLDLPDMRRQVIALTESQNVPAEVFADCYIVEIIDAASAWLTQQGSQTQAEAYYADAHQVILDIELGEAVKTNPFPQVPEYLAELKTHGIKTGVVTRNCRAAVYEVFPDIDTHMTTICARDDVPHFKPDPRHLTHCLDLMGATVDKSAMVGDGRMDMQVGRELGMLCVGVCSGSSDRAALTEAGANVVYDYCYEYLPP